MKDIFIILIVALMVLVFAISTQAQTAEPPTPPPTIEAPQPPDFPDELPERAEDALPFLRELLGFVSGLVATHVMGLIKKITWLGGDERFLKLVTELVAGLTATATAFILGGAAVLLGFLDESGLWRVIVYAWPMAFAMYHGKKLSSAGGALAGNK